MPDASDLPDAVKTFIVQRLACWDTPSIVAKAVKEEFGIDLPRQNVHCYDPTVKAGVNLSEHLKELFTTTRKAFTEATAEIGISHKAVRLRALDRMARTAEERGNIMGAAQLHQQAAREMGGAFSNEHRHKHTGAEGGPVVVEIMKYGSTPDADKAAK